MTELGNDAYHPQRRLFARRGRSAAVVGPPATFAGHGYEQGLRAGAIMITLIAGACFLVPALSGTGPDQIVGAAYQAPSWHHLFGTDSVGRDLFVRTLAGGRLDFAVAFVTVAASMVIGAVAGALAGASRRRWLDSAVMRVVDGVIAFPFLILVLVLVVIFGTDRSLGPLPAGAPAVMFGIILGNWAFYARISRGQTLALRDRDYVVAARLLGFSSFRIMARHILPGVLGTITAYAVSDTILAMITLASLSFVGVGVQPPAPEWGAIMYDGRAVLQTAWWIAVAPGVMLALTGLGLSLVADALLAKRGGQR